jgi:hypothetical protein
MIAIAVRLKEREAAYQRTESFDGREPIDDR